MENSLVVSLWVVFFAINAFRVRRDVPVNKAVLYNE